MPGLGFCCCCNSFYYVSTRWRGLQVAGDYPANSFSTKAIIPFPGTAANSRFTVDFRNSLLFLDCGAAFGGLGKANFANQFIESIGALNAPAGGLAQLDADWRNERVYYHSCIEQFESPSVTATWQVRYITYDGSSDVQLTTETTNADVRTPINVTGISDVAYDPTNHRVYYIWNQFTGRPPGGPYTDSNMYVYIKYIDADTGAGKTTIVTLEDTVNASGDYAIGNGLIVSKRNEKLAWIQGHAPEATKLITANLDGTNQSTIYTHSQTGLSRMNQLHYSEKEDRLYWVEQIAPTSNVNTKVKSCLFDGSDVKIHFDGDQGTLKFGSGLPSMALGCGHEDKGTNYVGP